MPRRRAPGRYRAPARRGSLRATPGAPIAPAPRPAEGSTTQGAQVGLWLGILAMVVLPLAHGWTLGTATNPFGSSEAVLIVEIAGMVAAAVALFLGRRARAAGDRSAGAVWAPRLGAAAIVGYSLTLVLLASKSG